VEIHPYPTYIVTEQLVKDILQEYKDNIPEITPEALTYTNMLLAPYLDRLNTITSMDELVKFTSTIPGYKNHIRTNVKVITQIVIRIISTAICR
jgi:signal transduction histidine kinase